MNMHTIPRATKRRPLGLMVKSRVQSRLVFVDLIDISEGGCKIRARPGFGNVGDRVVMKVGGVNAPLGIIAWVDNGLAGVAFEGEMHPAVLDHLCENSGTKIAQSRYDLDERHRHV
ncbi:MAG: PilZ domain-containing protein [Pseudomonadota bacterium]